MDNTDTDTDTDAYTDNTTWEPIRAASSGQEDRAKLIKAWLTTGLHDAARAVLADWPRIPACERHVPRCIAARLVLAAVALDAAEEDADENDGCGGCPGRESVEQTSRGLAFGLGRSRSELVTGAGLGGWRIEITGPADSAATWRAAAARAVMGGAR